MATIDELKSIASTKLGFARSNSFLVTLPSRWGADGREMNVLCTNTSLPGKQILTTERRIGMELQKMPYGYAIDDVSMTFYLMNDYGVKKYFDNWRRAIITDNFDLRYKEEYVNDVVIHQLRKPMIGFSKSIGPFRAGIGVGGGTVYSCKLIDAFPTTLQAVELSNELDGLVQFTVQLSYTNWEVDASPQNFITGSFNLGQVFG